MITIEQASQLDHLTLTEITFDGKAFWGYSKEQLQQWKNELTITKEYIATNSVFNLIFNSEIIGYYSFFKNEENQIVLDYLFILQKYIGKGFGNLLMDDFLQRAKSLNVSSIFLEAEPKAESFYKKFGFLTYDQKESSIKGRFLPQMKLIIS